MCSCPALTYHSFTLSALEKRTQPCELERHETGFQILLAFYLSSSYQNAHSAEPRRSCEALWRAAAAAHFSCGVRPARLPRYYLDAKGTVPNALGSIPFASSTISTELSQHYTFAANLMNSRDVTLGRSSCAGGMGHPARAGSGDRCAFQHRQPNRNIAQ